MTKKRPQTKHVRYAAANKLTGPRYGNLALSVNEEIRRDLNAIKMQSRKAGNDDGYVVRFLNMCETHVCGPEGFSFQSLAVTRSGKPDKKAQAIIETCFTDWGRIGNCDVTGRHSWQDIQNLFIRTVAEDGEILVRFVEGFPNRYGFAIQLLDCAHLDTNYNKDLRNGNRIKMGVELDQFGRHVAYHILTEHPGERSYYHGKLRYERIPSEEILLAYLPTRVGQLRGVPWAHAALMEMNQLYGYREAELTGARVGASKMFAYIPDSDVEPDEEDETDFVEEVEPGMSIVVPYGYSIKELDWSGSGQNFGAFNKSGLRGAASGLDVNYNALANDLEGVNFSSLRQAVLEDRDAWMKRQRWMRQHLNERIFSAWLKMSLAMGAIGRLQFTDFERLNFCKFQGRRWQWVDPLKDEKANSEAISNLTKSPLQIIREQGNDPETVIQEILEFEEMVSAVREKRQLSQPTQKATDPFNE